MNDKQSHARAKKDSTKTGDLDFEEDFLKGTDSFRVKHEDEKELLGAFEKECSTDTIFFYYFDFLEI